MRRGTFTGATGMKPGLFEVADGGTLFIDEIGELALGLQAKLLRVLEDGSLRRVGSVKERRVHVRADRSNESRFIRRGSREAVSRGSFLSYQCFDDPTSAIAETCGRFAAARRTFGWPGLACTSRRYSNIGAVQLAG